MPILHAIETHAGVLAIANRLGQTMTITATNIQANTDIVTGIAMYRVDMTYTSDITGNEVERLCTTDHELANEWASAVGKTIRFTDISIRCDMTPEWEVGEPIEERIQYLLTMTYEIDTENRNENTR